MLGGAFAASALSIPSWEAGSDNGNNVGGLIFAILKPAGGFGKFLTVVLALTAPSAAAPTMYSFGTSFMAISPWFAKVPRYVYLIIAEAMYVLRVRLFRHLVPDISVFRLIPLAIVGATRFYATLVNILSEFK